MAPKRKNLLSNPPPATKLKLRIRLNEGRSAREPMVQTRPFGVQQADLVTLSPLLIAPIASTPMALRHPSQSSDTSEVRKGSVPAITAKLEMLKAWLAKPPCQESPRTTEFLIKQKISSHDLRVGLLWFFEFVAVKGGRAGIFGLAKKVLDERQRTQEANERKRNVTRVIAACGVPSTTESTSSTKNFISPPASTLNRDMTRSTISGQFENPFQWLKNRHVAPSSMTESEIIDLVSHYYATGFEKGQYLEREVCREYLLERAKIVGENEFELLQIGRDEAMNKQLNKAVDDGYDMGFEAGYQAGQEVLRSGGQKPTSEEFQSFVNGCSDGEVLNYLVEFVKKLDLVRDKIEWCE